MEKVPERRTGRAVALALEDLLARPLPGSLLLSRLFLRGAEPREDQSAKPDLVSRWTFARAHLAKLLAPLAWVQMFHGAYEWFEFLRENSES